MDTINATMDGKLSTILETVRTYVGLMKSQFISLAETQRSAGLDMSAEVTGSHAGGGYIRNPEIAQLHGNEYVLNSPTVNALGGKMGIENLIASLRFPKSINASNIVRTSTSTSSMSNDNRVIFENANFPHIYDVSGLVRNMKQMQNQK